MNKETRKNSQSWRLNPCTSKTSSHDYFTISDICVNVSLLAKNYSKRSGEWETMNDTRKTLWLKKLQAAHEHWFPTVCKLLALQTNMFCPLCVQVCVIKLSVCFSCISGEHLCHSTHYDLNLHLKII